MSAFPFWIAIIIGGVIFQTTKWLIGFPFDLRALSDCAFWVGFVLLAYQMEFVRS